MYNRNMFKNVKHIVLDKVASTGGSTSSFSSIATSDICNIPGWTTKTLGQNFEATIEATSGAIYIFPESTAQPTSTNSFKIAEGGILDIKFKNRVNIAGDSTTAKFQALIWDTHNP